MLPVVRRKTFEIPHGLAAIAAGICLTLAFASDFKDREQTLRADLESRSKTELVTSMPEAGSDDHSAKTESSQRTGSHRQGRLPPARLLPWFPLQRNGG